MAKTTHETKVKATKPVDGEVETTDLPYNGYTDAVSEQVKALADLTWEERQAFARRMNEVVNQEADKRSQGNDFDTEAYY